MNLMLTHVCPDEAVSDAAGHPGLSASSAAEGSLRAQSVEPCGSAPAVRKTVLENGVRVVTESMGGVRSVSIAVLVDCGSKEESVEQAGLAHLCEHLSFQGTSSRDAMQIARQADSFGQVGGFTTRDYTCYFAATLDDYQFHALDLLGDVLLNSTFPDDCLSHEKQAILSEIERGADMPEQHVHDLAKRRAWPRSALGRPIAGDAATLVWHTREDLIYFFHRHYTADRMIVAAAGHLDHDDFVAQTRDAFWRLIGRSAPSPRETPEFHPGVTIESTNSAQAYFCLTIPAPPYAAPDRYVTHVLNRILGGGISSRLSRKLREEAGLVYAVQSEYHAYRDAGMISVEGSTGAQHIAEAIAIVLATLGNLLSGQEPVDAEELWRAKTHMRVQHLTSSEDVHTRMCRLATQELYFESHLDTHRILAHIDAVELGHLTAFTRDYLSRQLSLAHLAIVGPIDDEPALRSRVTRLMNECAWRGEPLTAACAPPPETGHKPDAIGK
jgi:predicted Zn-dependent peptidase